MDTQHTPKTVYCYDTEGRYTGTDLADVDTQAIGEVQYLMPRNSTDVPPPTPSSPKQSAFWDSVRCCWQVATDERKVRAHSKYMRETRNAMLAATDWTQIPDVPMRGELRGKWAYYRQRLRDLPEHVEWPFIAFPAPPEKEVANG